MNNAYNELIASYLAGDDVEEALILACKQDKTLFDELSKQVAFERVIKFVNNAQTDEAFVNSFQIKLAEQTGAVAQTKNISLIRRFARVFNNILNAQFAWRYVLQSAVLVCFVLVFVQQYSPIKNLGLVAKVVNAKSNKGVIQLGDNIKYGQFLLTQGFAEITLNNGVALLLEAPVDMTVLAVDRITLKEGNLVARVPKGAEGFKVDTPTSEIVDLGTEFGVSVDKKGKSQVHVIDGEVKVRASKDHQYEHLTVDQARAFDLKQQVAIIQSQPQRFMRTLPSKASSDPEYVHWPLNQEAGDVISCAGSGIDGKCFDGKRYSTVENKVGPEFIAGKFGEAVFFNGEDDWLETTFSGIGGNKPRTVAFWVKIPKDFAVNNGFGILSWGLIDDHAAWQVSPNPAESVGPVGRIRIGIKNAVVVGTTDLRDNEWHHVALVLFGGEESNLSTHVLMYIDGKLENTAVKSLARVNTKLNHPESKPLMMGRNLAFSNLKNKKQKYKFFKGGLDEVYVFDSALEQEHIINLMKHNQIQPIRY